MSHSDQYWINLVTVQALVCEVVGACSHSAVCVNMFEVYNSKSMKAYLIVSYSFNHQHMHFQDTLHGSSLLLLLAKVGDLKTIPIFHIFNYVPISPYISHSHIAFCICMCIYARLSACVSVTVSERISMCMHICVCMCVCVHVVWCIECCVHTVHSTEPILCCCAL